MGLGSWWRRLSSSERATYGSAIAGGTIAVVGGVIVAVVQVVVPALIADGPERPVTPTVAVSASLAPVQFADNELASVTNPRFGFSLHYPKTWSRSDPVNGDGNGFKEPRDDGQRVEILAFGSLAGEPNADEVTKRKSYLAEQPGIRIIQSEYAGMNLLREPGQAPEQIPGWRVLYEYTDEQSRQPMTTLARMTQVGTRYLEVDLTAPSALYPSYSRLFENLAADFVVLAEPT